MEKNNNEIFKKKNGLAKKIETCLLQWPENITVLELSDRNIINFDENVKLPHNLISLNLSHNRFKDVPSVVLNSRNLKVLDISHNRIKYFDNTPHFCHTIEHLNLASNDLIGPPYWIWSESPAKLSQLNLSYNVNISNSLTDDYFAELLQYTTLVSDIKLYNCRLGQHIRLLETFPKVQTLELGTADFSCYAANYIEDVPCRGLDKCCDIERLNLSNTCVYNININIDIYKYLMEINLSQNKISYLPNEFSNLENLEICILSYNDIQYLPNNMTNLKKLISLHVDGNQLCILPENIFELPNLKLLDVYDNNLYEVPSGFRNISELDLAQNFLEEPEHAEYIEKKERLRLKTNDRHDGRKIDVHRDSMHSPSSSDEEELRMGFSSNDNTESSKYNCDSSSSEDWDDDEYWVPHYFRHVTPPPHSPWLYFVKRKMEEGNFCPMDVHPVSVAEKVRYEKMCNPQVHYESDGQFDDYSDDNS